MADEHRAWTRQGEAFWQAHYEAWKRSDRVVAAAFALMSPAHRSAFCRARSGPDRLLERGYSL